MNATLPPPLPRVAEVLGRRRNLAHGPASNAPTRTRLPVRCLRGPAVPSIPMPHRSDLPTADAHATTADADEVALLAALRRGDNDAYATLLRQHGRSLFATARRMLGNEADARDALQEMFVSAFRAIGTFEGKSRLGTWLHRILVNAVLMRLRHRRHRPECSIDNLVPSFTDDGHHAEPPCPWSDRAIARLQSAESHAILWRAIDQLPSAYREVLVLRDLENLSTEAASTHLGITQNATKIRLHRARQALRTLLGDALEDLS